MSHEYMSPKRRFLASLLGGRVDRPSVASATSVVSVELMDAVGVYFPDAHLDAKKMAKLASTAVTHLGYDAIMPVYSVQHEAAALGCAVDWGRKDLMPDVKGRLCKEPEDIRIPKDFLDRPAAAVVLEALALLRKDYGRDVAIVGKVFGPWTLAYHLFGVQDFLILTIDDPEKVRRILATLKEVTVLFALAQIQAGADALTLGDHATGDLCSPLAYRDFLMAIHKELVARIPCPLILHICGDTVDRMRYIAETRVDCFHFDTRVAPAKARGLAQRDLSLMGGVNNPQTLLKGTPDDVRREVLAALDAGIDILGPECAVPLTTPKRNLAAIAQAVRDHSRRP
ncbi:MAG: MtaA/CmuA family methyltransferase [Planctomycetes bacterium]|nr:MtaA/CmuA family methyltransferase [Planctomycetota bacterium]